MAPLLSTIEIARPPEVVFAFATDPRRFAEWQPDVVSVQMLDERRFITTRRFAGAERRTTQKITRSDPPLEWAAEGIDGPIRPHGTITIEPLDDGARSRVTFGLNFEGHGAGAALVPMIRRAAAKGAPNSHQNLKRLLESETGGSG